MEVALITSVCWCSFVILGHISVGTVLSFLSKKEVSDASLFFLLTRLKIGGGAGGGAEIIGKPVFIGLRVTVHSVL